MSHNFVNPVDIVDSTDTTKKVRLDPSGGATSTTATVSTAQVADRTYSIPDSGANAAFVMTEGAQTINGTKTFKTSVVIQETSGTDGITIQAPALASSYSLTLPVDDGTADQVLTTNGSGVLNWQTFLPPGMLLPYAGSSTPSGFLLCDGTAVSRTTYASLFAAVGTLWGVGDGSTTFNVPNLSRRTLAGSGGASTGTLGNTTGSTGGAETLPAHDHAVGTLANGTSSVSGTVGGSDGTHTHTFTTGGISANHYHSYPSSNAGGGAGGTGASAAPFGSTTATGNGYVLNEAAGGGTGYVQSSVESADHTHSGTTNTTGSGHSHAHSLTAAAQTITGSTASTGTGSHGVIQPTAIVTYVIKF